MATPTDLELDQAPLLSPRHSISSTPPPYTPKAKPRSHRYPYPYLVLGSLGFSILMFANLAITTTLHVRALADSEVLAAADVERWLHSPWSFRDAQFRWPMHAHNSALENYALGTAAVGVLASIAGVIAAAVVWQKGSEELASEEKTVAA